MRLTTEVIVRAPTYVNPLKEREIDLRGIQKIGMQKIRGNLLRFSFILKRITFPFCFGKHFTIFFRNGGINLLINYFRKQNHRH